MPILAPSDDQLDFIVETQLKAAGLYSCDLLNDEITAAMQAVKDAQLSQTSSLGHSMTVDLSAARANLDTLLAARKLCQARKAAVDAGFTDAATIAAAAPIRDPMGLTFDFSTRTMR